MLGTRRYLAGVVTPFVQTRSMSSGDPFDDPVPRTVVLSLDDAFRVLEAIEDARLALREANTRLDFKMSWQRPSERCTVGRVSTTGVCCDQE